MSQQKQAPLPRQEFQEWLENAAVPVLVLQKGKHLGSVVKVPATPEIDYLFGCETFYGERISWSDRLEFCGLYDRQRADTVLCGKGWRSIHGFHNAPQPVLL